MDNVEVVNTEPTAKDTVSAPKPKRAYKKKEKVAEIAAPVVPAAPVRTPAMDKLEAEILEIVSQRSAANNALRNAKLTAEQAQLNLKNAQEFLFSLEQEVNYRMTLLGQLKGTPMMTGTPQNLNAYTLQPSIPSVYDPYGAPPQVSSVPPANPTGIEVVAGRRVRSEDAVAMRAML